MKKLTRRIRAFFLKRKMERSIKKLKRMIRQHKLDLIAEDYRYYNEVGR